MRTMESDKTVGQFVVERPSRARVFERFGIDYCCGGKMPLEEACRKKGLNVQMVLEALRSTDGGSHNDEATDWSRASMSDLADHIVSTHHAYLREELPRLSMMVDKVVGAHGERHTELPRCREIFQGLRVEMESHMEKEEQILFPMVKQLERPQGDVRLPREGIANPIRILEQEHDGAGEALAELRRLTGDYRPPADACNTYRAMLDGLAELEVDMHRHVHKENNILFPRAIGREADLAR
jgi:regulator of cell morphogenesis and NO signaling